MSGRNEILWGDSPLSSVIRRQAGALRRTAGRQCLLPAEEAYPYLHCAPAKVIAASRRLIPNCPNRRENEHPGTLPETCFGKLLRAELGPQGFQPLRPEVAEAAGAQTVFALRTWKRVHRIGRPAGLVPLVALRSRGLRFNFMNWIRRVAVGSGKNIDVRG